MAYPYETDTFRVLRAALFEQARDALYQDSCAELPCPDYQAGMRETLNEIRAAQSFDDLARIEWLQGQATMGEDDQRYGAHIPNL